jgi:hypothetical protein
MINTFINMETKLLETEYFTLLYPIDWDYDLIDNYIHSIFDKDGLGAFQISSYSTNDPTITYDIEVEKLDFHDPEIKDYGDLKAILSIETVNKSALIQWVIGKGRTKLFCTYTIAKSDFNSEFYKKEFRKIENIVKTITLK